MSAADKIAEARALMPTRIVAEIAPYDFPGYSPAWVWHSADDPIEEPSGVVAYVRADLADGREAEKARADALAQEVSELQEALRERDGGAHDADCRALRPAPHARPCNCGHDRAVYVLGATP